MKAFASYPPIIPYVPLDPLYRHKRAPRKMPCKTDKSALIRPDLHPPDYPDSSNIQR